MTKKSRAAAFIMALAVLTIMLFSTFYIADNADHTCIGDRCPVCEQIKVCENTLHGLSFAVIVMAAAIFAPLLCSLVVRPISNCYHSFTLVSLKVKLSN